MWTVIIILLITVFILCLKICLMRRSAREIEEAFRDRLETETNTLIDIASRNRCMRRLAESINEQLRIFRSERHRFQQGDRELKEAVTNISHDLRTPLTAICGYLDLLESEDTSETVSRYLAVIRDRSESLTQLMEELFCYAVVTAPSYEINYEEMVLNHVLEECLSDFYAIFRTHSIVPQIRLPEQKVVRRLDRKAVIRVFENIISNAVKYSDGDLTVTLTETGEVRFSNHAAALDKVQVGRLFDRFYTVEDASQSTGLGLSIAKTLTEQMGGHIGAVYEEGEIRISVWFGGVDKTDKMG